MTSITQITDAEVIPTSPFSNSSPSLALSISSEAQENILHQLYTESPTTFSDILSFCRVSANWNQAGSMRLYYSPLDSGRIEWNFSRTERLRETLENRSDLAEMVKDLKELGTLALGLGRSIEFYAFESDQLRSQLDLSNGLYWSLAEKCKKVEKLGLIMSDISMERNRMVIRGKKVKELYLSNDQDLSNFYTESLSLPTLSSWFTSIESDYLESITFHRLLFSEDDMLKRSTDYLEPMIPLDLRTIKVAGFFSSTSTLTRFLPIDPSHLQTLEISLSSKPLDSDLRKLIELLPSLERFVYRLSDFVDYELPQFFYTSFPSLKSLELNGFSNLTLEGFEQLLDSSPDLSSIIFDNCTWSQADLAKKDFLKRFKEILSDYEDLELDLGVFPFSVREMKQTVQKSKKRRVSLKWKEKVEQKDRECCIM